MCKMARIWFVLLGIYCVHLLECAFCQTDQAASMLTGLLNSQNITGSAPASKGILGFSWAGLIGGFIFSAVGLVAFSYGKKQANMQASIVGIALMAYPYFVRSTFWMFVVGFGLCFALYMWRE